MLTVLLLVAVALLAFIAWKVTYGSQRGDALGRTAEELGELKRQLTETQRERDELSGKNKQLFATLTALDAEHKALQRECNALKERLAIYETETTRRAKDHEEKLRQLSEAQRGFEEEKLRVRREDDERRQHELAERDRLWNEHEQKVIVKITELCERPEFGFRCYNNNNLPKGFDGSFKPDACVEFLGQYVIFDAKISRSENFPNYVRDQVQKTAKKVKGRTDIYPTIFLVVPTDAIAELKETSYAEGGFTFYVIPPEALTPILAALKKVTTYEFVEQLDPQERENVIYVVARLERHIDERNALDVLLAKMGAELLGDVERMRPGIAKEVQQQKEKMRLPTFKPSEVKKLISSVHGRNEEIGALMAPRALINETEVQRASAVLGRE